MSLPLRRKPPKASQVNVFQRNAKYIVILAVILGSFSAIFAKLITAPPVAIGFYRLTFALPFFAIPILLKHRDVLRKISGKDYGLCLLGGGFLAGHFFSWFTAVQTTTIASAVVLAALHPIVVLITTILIFKTPVPVKAVLGILLPSSAVPLLRASIIPLRISTSLGM